MRQFFNHRGQIAGTLHDDGVFRKVVSGKYHLYKNEQGWGIDEKILESLPDGTEIRIKDKDDDTIYITTKENFRTGSKIDFGHGTQLVLWKKYFDIVKKGERIESPYIDRWLLMYDLFENHPETGAGTI